MTHGHSELGLKTFRGWRVGLFGILLLGISGVAWALVDRLGLVSELHEPQAAHVFQTELTTIEDPFERFKRAFETGDELFETVFNALDGSGANVGAGLRYTRVPRADLSGPGEWARHVPARVTGPNAQACNACHRLPFDDGAGPADANVVRDPFHTANLGRMITRNTPHLFAPGAVQRLAEEMTTELQAIREAASAEACASRNRVTRELGAKGVNFGAITVIPGRLRRCPDRIVTGRIKGVGDDLIIRPFQWKGSDPTLRGFNREAAHRELGMQPVELVGDDTDGDFDNVVNELTVGDLTALTVYLAAQPRPVTKTELATLGLIDLTQAEMAAIDRGEQLFHEIGCNDCHRSTLLIDAPLFSEPSQHPSYRDAVFPAGQDPLARGVDPSNPVMFDLTLDQPDNILEVNGAEVRLGSFERDDQGRAIVRLLGDLKRHDMGPGLAEAIDEVGTGASVFLTENLWGVGSTAPYLHDGRATTLTEAILEHGGEAASSRAAFLALSSDAQKDLIAFLNNLVLFKLEE